MKQLSVLESPSEACMDLVHQLETTLRIIQRRMEQVIAENTRLQHETQTQQATLKQQQQAIQSLQQRVEQLQSNTALASHELDQALQHVDRLILEAEQERA